MWETAHTKRDIIPQQFGARGSRSRKVVAQAHRMRQAALTIMACALVAVLATDDRAYADALVVEEVRQTTPAFARFEEPARQGETDRAVLFLHGFLQTYRFPTVARQVDALSVSGVPVLAPTLSLRVPYRLQSMPCEAIHAHSMDDAVAEVAHWVAWLVDRGYEEINLVGHSAGAVQLMAYLEHGGSPAVTQVITVGLTELGREMGLEAVRPTDSEMVADSEIRGYSISMCGNNSYRTTPEAYESYARWNASRILQLIRSTETPITVIVGEADARMPMDWAAALAEAGAQVETIDGAGHFFGAEYEMDLADVLRDLIRE